jgi:hypothetical protein
MELLPLLRRAWRRRLVLVGALVASIAVFVALGGSRSSRATIAVAWTQVALDTPHSQLVAATPAGADTLPWRASLLMDLLASDASTRAITQRLGATQDELTVVDPSASLPTVQTSTAVASAKAASLLATPYVLEVFLSDPSLPVISIEAGAARRSGAERLAAAAVAFLKSQASPGGRFSSPIRTDADPRSETLQPFTIDQLTPVQVKLFPSSAQSLKPIAGALLVFLMCCAFGGRLASLARRLRPPSRALAA